MTYDSKIKQYFFVIKELVSREIKRKYARSNLGILWSVLNPLLSMVVMSMIFTTIFKRNIENFPIYYLTGSIFWNLFTGATNSAMTALVDNKNMLIKVKLPTEIFPLARSCTALTNFGYSLVAYVIMLIVFRVTPSITMLLLPVYAILLFLFSLGIGNILSILYVFFGDIKHLYSVILTIWMYCSAIFYPVSSTAGTMQKVILANPVYTFIAAARKCVLEGGVPTKLEWLQMLVWSLGIYLIGKIYFSKMQNRVMQHI
ncbi:ABC transporter permease [Lachnospiraceae bacterium OttesenSCG-928-D06]|nr:ABC transporter permease [Lachnospiraceae bacterium OttesenSCG-928-D06]